MLVILILVSNKSRIQLRRLGLPCLFVLAHIFLALIDQLALLAVLTIRTNH